MVYWAGAFLLRLRARVARALTVLACGLPRADSASPQQQVWEKLVFLSRTCSCDSAAQWFQQVIAHVAREAEAHIDVWGDYQWHSRGLDVFATVKRRRIDHHVK